MQYLQRITTRIGLPLLLISLSGCSLLQPHHSQPNLPVTPPTWTAEPEKSLPVNTRWLNDLADPALTELIKDAVDRNFDLKAAASRVDAAAANAKISGADRLPQISASLNASRAKRNSIVGGNLISGISNNFQTGLEISWEADIWGRLSHQTRATVFELAASESDYQAARFSLAANIARQWFNSVEAFQQVQLAEETVKNFQRAEDIIVENYQAGINSALDVRLARTNVATAQSQHAARQAQLDSQLRSLQILLGHYPSSSIKHTEKLPELTSNVPAGLPSELLQRRPDLMAAERRLLATDERVSQAKKNRLPQFRLTTSGGSSTDEFKNLLDSDTLIWSFTGGITAPLFQGGRLKANQALATANANQALHQYAQTALNAFREVETALAATPLLKKQQQALKTAVGEAYESEQLAGEQYRAGLVDIITWLEAQRQLFTARSNLLQIKNQQLQNRIDLHLALGGDFMQEDRKNNKQTKQP